MVLQEVLIIEKTIDLNYVLTFEYKNLSKVMRILKEENATISNQKLELSCEITFLIRKKNAEKLFGIFTSYPEISIKKIR
jgi:putative IMPACT (imprinted ancient) family translation regulator